MPKSLAMPGTETMSWNERVRKTHVGPHCREDNGKEQSARELVQIYHPFDENVLKNGLIAPWNVAL